MGAVIPKLRASARGRPCSVRTFYCNHDPETTVLAHLPSPVKGMGTKSNDWHAVFACSSCHDVIDRRVHHEMSIADICLPALEETQRYWIENGYLVVPGVLVKQPKPSSKTVQRSSLYAERTS